MRINNRRLCALFLSFYYSLSTLFLFFILSFCFLCVVLVLFCSVSVDSFCSLSGSAHSIHRCISSLTHLTSPFQPHLFNFTSTTSLCDHLYHLYDHLYKVHLHHSIQHTHLKHKMDYEDTQNAAPDARESSKLASSNKTDIQSVTKRYSSCRKCRL